MGLVSSYTNIVSKKFTKLTALSYIKSNYGRGKWLCFCDCGKFLLVKFGSLNNNSTRSCGCLRKETKALARHLPIGYICNDLRVIGFNSQKERYECKCKCGNIVLVAVTPLKRNIRVGCGCTKTKKRKKKVRTQQSYIGKIYFRYKGQAKINDRTFTISREEFSALILDNCTYCGSAPTQTQKEFNGEFYYNGIDRIDSSMGYEVNNCITCCIICNRAKNNMPQILFLSWIDNLVKFRGGINK